MMNRGVCQLPGLCKADTRGEDDILEENEFLRKRVRKLKLEKVVADRLYEHLHESLKRSAGASSDTVTQSLLRDWERTKVRVEVEQ